MNPILSNSLYHLDKSRFSLIRDMAKSFNATCNGNNIVQDDIFNIIKNYGRRNGQVIEIIRLPIKDDNFCACTFVRRGTIFIVSNSCLPASKQIFAAAHELYHIIKYINGDDEDFIFHGSILKAEVLDDIDIEAEDRDANAFAGLFLAPSNALSEQIEIYGISADHVQVRDILRLMDIFAIPYKAVILRLYEDNLISEKTANALLNTDSRIIEKQISLTGMAMRWQKIGNEIVELGSLKESMSANEQLGFITDNRAEADRKRISELMKKIQN